MTSAEQTYLIQVIEKSFSPATQKQAESELFQLEKNPNFINNLIQIIQSNQNPAIRTFSLIYLKNFIKKYWDEDNEDNLLILNQDQRNLIKSNLVSFMLSLPKTMRNQISEIITIIADYDFPEKWPGLIQDLVQNLNPNDFTVNNGILQTAESLFKRWRHQFRTDNLFSEILFVLKQFTAPYLELFQATDQLIQSNSGNAATLQTLFESLNYILEIFYSFNTQDIPEFFEDNMTLFMGLLHKYLIYENPAISDDLSDDEEGPLEKSKASICEIIDLYTKRYEDLFHPFLPKFVESVWHLLMKTGLEPKYDLLVSKAISFLTSVVKLPRHHPLFLAGDTLQQIAEKIILSNMSLRESDLELFEDEPMQFVALDVEGSDIATRRKASSDLVRVLLEQFPSQFTQMMSNYVTHYLQKYSSKPSENWRDYDIAIYLVSSLATKGSSKLGATHTNELVNIVDFCSSHIIPLLQNSSVHAILQVDAIKFIHAFRIQLTKDQLTSILPLLINLLKSSNIVVYTWATICIERILFLKKDKVSIFQPNDVTTFAQPLFSNLFSILERFPTSEKLSENEYIMKCIMRTIIALKEKSITFANILLTKLQFLLELISKNPSNPKFNHYMFESIGGLLRSIVTHQTETVAACESALFPSFQLVLQNDVSEFIPYVFQLLSLLLESHKNQSIPESYKILLPPLLQPPLWESRGNIPALIKYLKAFLIVDCEYIVSQNHLSAYFGIFQKLISSKMNDHHGFDLINAIIENVPLNVLSQYLPAVLTLQLTRLQKSKTPKFTKGFIVFNARFMALDPHPEPLELLINTYEHVQSGIFSVVLSSIIIPEIPTIKSFSDQKTVVVGYTRLLTSQTPSIQQAYPSLLETLGLFVKKNLGKLDKDVEEELDDLNLEENDLGYHASFNQLKILSSYKTQPFPNIADFQQFFVTTIKNSTAANPALSSAITSSSGEIKELLQ